MSKCELSQYHAPSIVISPSRTSFHWTTDCFYYPILYTKKLRYREVKQLVQSLWLLSRRGEQSPWSGSLLNDGASRFWSQDGNREAPAELTLWRMRRSPTLGPPLVSHAHKWSFFPEGVVKKLQFFKMKKFWTLDIKCDFT